MNQEKTISLATTVTTANTAAFFILGELVAENIINEKLYKYATERLSQEQTKGEKLER